MNTDGEMNNHPKLRFGFRRRSQDRITNNRKTHASEVKSSIKVFLYVFLTISVLTANASSISKHFINADTSTISSFCVHEKCTVVFPNGTSRTLPISDFHTFITEYKRVSHKNQLDWANARDIDSHLGLNLHDQINANEENSTQKYEGSFVDVTEFDSNINTTVIQVPPINDHGFAGEVVEQDSTTVYSIIPPSDETNATEITYTTIYSVGDEIYSPHDANESGFGFVTNMFPEKRDRTYFSSERGHEIESRSVSKKPPCQFRSQLDNGTSQKTTSKSKCSRPGCCWGDDSKENDTTGSTTEGYGGWDQHDPVTDEYGNPVISSTSDEFEKVRTTTEMEYDYFEDEDEIFLEQEPIIKPTREEMEEAEKMTECVKLKTIDGMVCVCNETYCDKFIPPDPTPKWVYTWYMSSEEGHRLKKSINNMTVYEGHEEGAFYVNTSSKYQKIVGFGGAFTDTACKLISDLSKETKKNLLESYFGLFGINYKLGRVPIGGTDFSPRFYTYMDKKDESMSTFMLTELDFKFKIPIILQAMNMSHNQLKLIGSAWWAPLWMKTLPSMNRGTLKREYWSQWAEYHVKFLDQYSRNDIKFWAISTGNRPMNSHDFTYQPNISTMEWTPYEQSEWVASYLNPTLKNSSHSNVLLLAFDDNREFATFYLKYFFEGYQLKCFDDSTCSHKSRVKDAVSGIAFHGYMDYKGNLPYLQQTKNMFPDKFLIYTETGCVGPIKLGAWICGETFAIRIIQALNNWVTGWMDWNIALDPKGGPKLADNLFYSPITIDTKQDEFYKDPTFYVIAHFSVFLLPNSYRIEVKAPRGLEGIHAVAGYRPDDGKVIVFYNQNEGEREVIFLIDEKYKLSLNVLGKSINSVLYW